jgi:hypothetical protein
MAAQIVDITPSLPTFIPPSGGQQAPAQQDDTATNGGVADGRAQAIAAANARLATAGLPSYADTGAAPDNPASSALGNIFGRVSNAMAANRLGNPNVVAHPLDTLSNFLFNPVGSPQAKAMAARDNAATTFANSDVNSYLNEHPDVLTQAQTDPVGIATKLGPMLEAMVAQQQGKVPPAQIAHPNGMVKDDNNPVLTKHSAAAMGVTEGQAHASQNTHQYSWPEFVAAMKGVNNSQLRMMWGMQHYLAPAQQAGSSYLAELQGRTTSGTPEQRSAAQKTYDSVRQMTLTPGFPPF